MAKSNSNNSIGIYEAKAQLSKLIRAVKRHRVTFQISERGVPVARLSPVQESDALEDRIAQLEEAGLFLPPADESVQIKTIAKRTGALARFLEDRD